MQRALRFALAAAAAGNAAAQGVQRPDPSDPSAGTPPVQYRSAFEGYRPYAEVAPGRWREANEEMQRLGGPLGHVPRPPAAGKPAPKPAAHAGHGGSK